MTTVAVLLENGFEELEAMGPIDLLTRAGCQVDMIAVNNESVSGRCGVQYGPTIPMKEYDFSKADCLFLPGGPHHTKLRVNPSVLSLVHEFAEKKIIAAICASPTIFGQEGLLKGKNYTCFTSMNADFGGTYHEDYAVIDGNMITGKSAAAAIDFGFAMMEVLCGKEKVEEIKASIYY
ncbi:MAG: DJ-1/PfpI family protein [Bacillota bacterium]|nr:DJ-1/PfpI family protein [Bacillota bacterium]